jgi:superfamily II DNA or RNA helicase
LGKFYDDLIVASTTAELIKGGYLCSFRAYAPSHPDLSGVRTVAGDFEERGLSVAMNKAPLIADVVQTWLERAEGRPTLCFAVDRAHAKRLHMEFEAAEVPAAYIDAYTSAAERKEIERRLHAAEVTPRRISHVASSKLFISLASRLIRKMQRWLFRITFGTCAKSIAASFPTPPNDGELEEEPWRVHWMSR